MADEETHQEARCDILDVVQSMIDISADRLEGLRTQCATSAELTQQEIRTLEVRIQCMKGLWLRFLLLIYSDGRAYT
jgi:kinase suppressor of Ras 2